MPLLGCRTVKSTQAPVQRAGLSGKLPEVFRWESQEQIHSQTHMCVYGGFWKGAEKCGQWSLLKSEGPSPNGTECYAVWLLKSHVSCYLTFLKAFGVK